jgi:hypothetical protein
VKRVSSRWILPFICSIVAYTAFVLPARAIDSEDPAMLDARPWPTKRLPCTDATIRVVQPRLGGSDTPRTYPKAEFESGVEVIFALPKGYRFFNSVYAVFPSVTHYQDQPQNDLMMSGRPGDRVQICLVGMPVPEYSATSNGWICNPDTDGRGYSFRVYDYKRHAAYVGTDFEHGCGGA